MVKQKKIISFLLITLFVISILLTGCGANNNKPAENKTESWPSRPITILCWSSPGAPNDLTARMLAQVGEKYFGVPMVVENITGGSGTNMMRELLNRPADGHTFATNTISMVDSIVGGNVPYKLTDFAYLVRTQLDPYSMVVRADSPFQSLDDLVDYARANPGSLTVGGFGAVSAHSVSAFRFFEDAGVEINWIAFDGGAEAITAALGGHIDVAHTNPAGVMAQIEAGTMRALSISARDRISIIPDAKTYNEFLGRPLELYHWRGTMTHKDVPQEIIDKMAELIIKTLNDPDFVKFTESNYLLGDDMGPKEFNQFVLNSEAESREIISRIEALQ